MSRLGLLPLLAALLLSGCWWEGPILYAPDPAAPQPLMAGLYETTDKDGKVEQSRIARNADGTLSPGADDGSKGGQLFFVPFPVPGRHLWISEMISTDPASPGAAFGLVELHGEKMAYSMVIDCDATADMVRAAGGVVEKTDKGLTCRFNDKASLERALTAYLALHPKLDDEMGIKRVGD
jgi:hypothetical protein